MCCVYGIEKSVCLSISSCVESLSCCVCVAYVVIRPCCVTESLGCYSLFCCSALRVTKEETLDQSNSWAGIKQLAS